MDRITRAVHRLWGSVGHGRLAPAPRFASELAAAGSNGKLPLMAPEISKWSFGHQLEHAYRSAHYVLDRLEESLAAKDRAGRMGFWGVGMMIGGFIPRGMFPTIPPLEPTGGTLAEIRPLQQSLDERLAKIGWGIAEIKNSPGKSRHPRMKYLTSGQWMFFWDIHHRHHLAIMRDIAKAAR
jgi:hypothetical protein